MAINIDLTQAAEAGLNAVDSVRRLERLIPQDSAIPRKIAQTGFNSALGFTIYQGEGSRYGKNVNNNVGAIAQSSVASSGNVGVS